MANNVQNYENQKKWYSFKEYNWFDWYAFTLFFVYSLSVAFFIYDLITALLKPYGGYYAWTTIDKFTDQSNILLWFYMLFSIFFKKHSFLKNNQWLLSNLTYIFFTFIGYNVILVGFAGYQYGPDPYDAFSSVWYHVISPITYFIFGFLFFYLYKDKQPQSYWKSMLKQMVYPSFYVVYIMFIPFVMNTSGMVDNQGQPIGTYAVYGNFTNLKDKLPVALPVILGMWLIFFPASFAMFYYSWIGFNRSKLFKNRVSN
ncbi:MAG: DUF1600 domain-containing protein [Malacoplasma sp.]|nr:DUF1600 domain-containing protein [Malacoplasma sp.]